MSNETSVLSHWYFHFEDLQLSSQEFYHSIEERLAEREYPDLSLSRPSFSEGGLFSADREYLCVSRLEYRFYICAAPFGKSFFVSWWLKEEMNSFLALLEKIPFIGGFLSRKAHRKTFYQMDAELLFKESVKRVVDAVIDEVMKAKGLRALTGLERNTIEG